VLFDTLHKCGFREAERTLYPFPYDWRKSNAAAAQGLAALLDTIAEQQPDEILLIAHSMGGLISRYYLESGHFRQRPGIRLVSSLICLETPHYGSPLALTAALGMERRVFLNEQQVYKLVRRSQFPSLYQLLPPPGTPFAWNRELREKLTPMDIYNAKTAERLCAYQAPDRLLNQQNLASAASFRKSLDLSKRTDSVRYFFFAGTRQRTATTSFIIPAGELLEVRNHEVDDGGDGTVPFWSASVTGMQVSAVGGEHGTIYKNEELTDVLKALLGARGMLAARAELPPELSVRDHVVDPGGTFPVALTFRAGIEEVTAEIRIEKLKDEMTRTYGPTLSVSQFAYKGGGGNKPVTILFHRANQNKKL
jgi:phospholipase A1